MIRVPGPDASLNVILEFALSFDGYKFGFEPCGRLANHSLQTWEETGQVPATLDDLRMSLFFEQRRWRHFGYPPDEETTRYLRQLVAAIEELSGGEVICERPDIYFWSDSRQEDSK